MVRQVFVRGVKTFSKVFFIFTIFAVLAVAMNAERLPVVNSDPNTWGGILNDRLVWSRCAS